MTGIGSVASSSSSWPSVSDRFSQMNSKAFAKIDADGDGSIDKAELQAAFDKIASATGGTPLKADDLFSAMDTDGDGKVSASEFDTGAKSLLPQASSTVEFASQRSGAGHADRLFSKLDSDGDGSLDASELQAMLDKKAQRQDVSGQGSAPVSETGADLLKKLDTDGDGMVSKAEFAAGRPQHASRAAGASGTPPAPTAAPESGTRASAGGSGGSAASTSATASSDPADTNGDGVVSAQERAAADLKALLAGLFSATDFAGETSTASSSTSVNLVA